MNYLWVTDENSRAGPSLGLLRDNGNHSFSTRKVYGFRQGSLTARLTLRSYRKQIFLFPEAVK